jgi:hypothetical protein
VRDARSLGRAPLLPSGARGADAGGGITCGSQVVGLGLVGAGTGPDGSRAPRDRRMGHGAAARAGRAP